MTPPPGRPAARLPRPQARSLATRRRIVDAAVGCIDEMGFARATFEQIARRAGVTVGAVQHHFANKAEVLAAVLDHSFDQLSAAFDGVDVSDCSLEQRVHVFVERAWRRYGSPSFRSTFEIVLSAREAIPISAGGATPAKNWAAHPVAESARRARVLWMRIFDGLDIAPERHREIRRFAFVSLSGLAMSQRLRPASEQTRRQLELLETALVSLLQDARTAL